MAKQIKDEKVVLGRVIEVENQNRKAPACHTYLAVQVEDEDGENERCVLFTKKEFDSLSVVGVPMMESFVHGRLYAAAWGGRMYRVCWFEREGVSRLYAVPFALQRRVEERAKKNPEDLTEKSFLTDLFD